MKNYQELSRQLIDLVGGKPNISKLTHCVTRIRFILKDRSLLKEAEISRLTGVIGTQWLGEQFQVIVGTESEAIYGVLCQVGDFTPEAAIDENLDQGLTQQEGNVFKRIGNAILGYVSPTMTAVIPMMMGACLCKTIDAILGPGMLGVISAESDVSIVLNFLYSAFFYFIPIFLGYSAARTLNMNPIYGLYLGAIIIVPGFMALMDVRETISIFGIPAPVANYSASFLPVILGVWIMYYVHKALNKVIPEVLKSIFVPLLVILIMAPVMFVVCAPLGTYVGNLVGSFFIALSQSNIVLRVFGAVLLAVVMPYMVLCGMHGALLNFALMTFFANGFETFILPIMMAYNFAVFGVALGAILKLKKPENKTAVVGYFISGILGSVTEPCLYGVILKYRQTMKALVAACAAAGLIVGILTPIYYVMSSATIFTFWVSWVAGGTGNLMGGLALMLGAFAVGTAAACFVKYEEN